MTIVTATFRSEQGSDDGWYEYYFDATGKRINVYWVPDINYIRIGNRGNLLDGFFRFANISIPKNARILEAYVTLEVNYGYIDEVCRLRIWGEKTGNAATFTPYTRLVNFSSESIADYLNRRMTDNFIDWIFPPSETNLRYNSPDISSIIQEIVNQDTWNAGNALALFFKDNGGDYDGQREIKSFEQITGAPTLVVKYEVEEVYHRLSVNSSPISVNVNIDGVPVGTTPIDQTLSEGIHNIEVLEEVTT